MKKIIIISTVGLIYDGITSVITSYLKVMDLTNYEVHVVSTINCEEKIRDDLKTLGCIVWDFPNRREHPAMYLLTLSKYIRRNKIDVVHVHGNSATMAIEMMAALIGGAKKRIAHSHNTRCNHLKTDKVLRLFFNVLYTDALACGIDAGRWMFGNKEFQVLKNGRDSRIYAFDPDKRKKMRDLENVSEKLVVGHVGGFVEQKNHLFLIDIFRSLLEKNENTICYLIGDGELREKIEVYSEDIKSNLRFVGNTHRVSDYLQMMDVMVLPSLFEGLPLVTVEWQMNGLPCVVSDTVTKECKLTELLEFASLDEKASEWADKIISMSRKKRVDGDGCRYINQVKEKGFDIRDSVRLLESIYEG